MHVLHIIDYFWPATEWGGPTVSVRLLTRALAAEGARVSVVTTSTRGSPALPALERGTRELDGTEVSYAAAFGPRRFFFSPELARLVRARASAADVVHVHGVWTFGFIAAALAALRAGKPYVVSPRGMLDPWSLAQRRLKKQVFMGIAGRRLLRGAALVHFTAEGERASAPAFVRQLPWVVVPNPVDTAHLDGTGAAAVHDGPLRLIASGRIHPKKGFDVLLPAVRRARDSGTPVELAIAGPDEDGHRRRVERLVGELGLHDAVRFAGSLDRAGLARELGWADVLVMPSYQENFGMAAAEAMAAGRAVIVSDRVDIAPEIEAAGAGLVTPLDPVHLEQAIRALAGDPGRRLAMGARGQALVRARYAPAAVARAMLAAYASLG